MTRSRLLLGGWLTLWGLLIWLYNDPVNRGVLRVEMVLTWIAFYAVAWGLFGRSRPGRIALLVPLLLVVAGCLLSGPDLSAQDLRSAYVTCLRRYEGVVYVWGGEGRRGIDCSGLVRKGMIDACREHGILHPQLLRRSVYLWWHDFGADGLRDGVLGLTRPLLTTKRLADVPTSALQDGDVMTTANGEHTMVYLGGGQWIEADPLQHKVLVLSSSDPSVMWFKVPACVVRWKCLE